MKNLHKITLKDAKELFLQSLNVQDFTDLEEEFKDFAYILVKKGSITNNIIEWAKMASVDHVDHILNSLGYNIYVKCGECDGKGCVDVRKECDTPISSCCGSCYEEETCNHCDGQKELTINELINR